MHETIGCAVLDCGAAKSVCGQYWLNTYIDLLKENDLKQVEYSRSSNTYKFGYGNSIKAIKSVKLPIYLGSKKVQLQTDVVEKDIPLLFSRMSMKRGKAQLDTHKDTATIVGEKIPLLTTSTGHYAIPLCNGTAALVSDAKVNLMSSVKDQKLPEMAIKLHKQFAHPHPERLISLLDKSNYKNKELNDLIREVSKNCKTCLRYKRAPPRPVVGMPLANRFNQTVAMDLKFIRGKPVLHLIDLFTRYSASIVVRNKEPKVILDNIFKIWISIFGTPEMFISDNGGEFANYEFTSMGEKFNIRVTTTAAESPWANGVCERYNAVIGEMAEKILDDVECSLDVAVAWANSAKNSLSTVHGFSPAQLVFGFNPMLPSTINDKPPALSSEEAYSDLVEENLRALKCARAAMIKSESSEKIRRALNHRVRASNDVKYLNGDLVYFKRKDDKNWHGPASVIGQDGQMVLVRYHFTWVRVHPCRLQLVENCNEKLDIAQDPISYDDEAQLQPPRREEANDEMENNTENDIREENVKVESNDIQGVINQNAGVNNRPDIDTIENNNSESANVENTTTNIPETIDVNDNIDVTNQNTNIPETIDINDDVAATTSTTITTEEQDGRNTNLNPLPIVPNNDHSQIIAKPNKCKPYNKAKKFKELLKKGEEIKFKYYDEEDWLTGKLVSRSGTVRGKYPNEWNCEINGKIEWIDFDRQVESVQTLNKETPENTTTEIFTSEIFLTELEEKISNAKIKELEVWKEKQVYEEIDRGNEKPMGLKWVVKPKFIDGVPDIKARLVCKGCEEDPDFRRDSPACSRPSIRIGLTIIAGLGWELGSIDAKCAFLQSDNIERHITVKPPKEAKTDKIWLLKKTPYGLKDASRTWYLKVKKELTNLDCEMVPTDPAVFYWHYEEKLNGIILCYVDDMMYGGTKLFISDVITPLQQVIAMGEKNYQAFSYIGVNLVQNPDMTIYLDQKEYVASLTTIEEINSYHKTYMADREISDETKTKMRSLVGQINWAVSMSRPDVAFYACLLSTIVCRATEKHVVKLNKVVSMMRNTPLILKYSSLEMDKIFLEVYTDAAYGNLHDGSSQGGYLILASDGSKSTPIDWSSHKLKRVSRSTLTAETQAILDGIEAAILYQRVISQMLNVDQIPIICYTDCKSLVDNAETTHFVKEKTLRIEMAALREYVENKCVNVEWVTTKEQLADVLTKDGVPAGLLRYVLQEGKSQ